MNTYAKEVETELNCLQEIGVNVPAKSFTLLRNDQSMREYENSGASVTDTADLLISLGSM